MPQCKSSVNLQFIFGHFISDGYKHLKIRQIDWLTKQNQFVLFEKIT